MANVPPAKNKGIRTIVLLMLFGFFLYRIDLFWGLLSRFFAIVTAFIVGGLMAMLINLPMRFLERHLRFLDHPALKTAKRTICLTIAALLVVSIVVLLLLVIIPEVVVAVESLINRIPGLMQQLEDWLATYNTNIRTLLGISYTNEESVRDLFQRASDFLLGGINYSSTVVVSAAQMIINFVVGLVFAIYLLFSKERIIGQIRSLTTAYIPPPYSSRLLDFLQMSITTYSAFIGGQCLQSLLSAVMIWLLMAIFGFPYAVLIALVTFVCAFIPIFGPYVAGALGTLLVVTVAPAQAGWFLLIFFVAQQLEGSLIYPRILSSAIDIPSIWVLVAVTLGGGVMGIAGMLLFIPLAAVLYRLLARSARARNAARQEAERG
ncbi:MAG: AI-2E family transporter [Christensenellales bacterium]